MAAWTVGVEEREHQDIEQGWVVLDRGRGWAEHQEWVLLVGHRIADGPVVGRRGFEGRAVVPVEVVVVVVEEV